jgi:hypothetical protein
VNATENAMKFRYLLVQAMLCLVALVNGSAALAAEPLSDATAVRQVLMAAFDKPEARLQVEPVVTVGAHAVAGWTQGDRGGRALLHKDRKGWAIVLCAGDGLKDAKLLREAGVPSAQATTLAQSLAKAEAALPAAQRAKFATFDGVVRMDAAGQHPPSHAPAHAPSGGSAHKH